MDEIKKYWKILVVQQFWILSGLLLLLSVGVFFYINGSIGSLITQRTAKVDGAFKQISSISSVISTHPNSHSHKMLDEIVSKLELEVTQAWRLQYDRQAPLLLWPAKAFSSKNETLEIMKNLRPIEQFVEFPVDANLAPINKITATDRNVYKQYIRPEFAEISKIIGTEWKVGKETSGSSGSGLGMGSGGMGGSGGMRGSGGMGGPGGMGSANVPAIVNKDLVRWSMASQQQLMNQVLPWYSSPTPPSVLEIYYTQEDIWLLTSIMEIIKATNGSAVENFQTKVREIESISMGRFANRDAGVLSAGAPVGGMGSGGMGSGGMGSGSMSSGGMSSGGMGSGSMSSGGMGSGGMGSGGMGSGGMGSGGMGSGGASGAGSNAGASTDGPKDPADGRYITFVEGKEFESLTGADLRNALKDSPQNAVDAVAKRVPIRIRLKIDPNYLNTLITECGNAKMMLEVYQVRYNVGSSSIGGGGGFGGGELGGGAGASSSGRPGGRGGMGSGSMGSGSLGSGSGSSDSSSSTAEPDLQEISVEIFGLIYLYNPVNIGSLGTDKVTEVPIGEMSKGASLESTTTEPVPSPEVNAPPPSAPTSPPSTPPASESGVDGSSPSSDSPTAPPTDTEKDNSEDKDNVGGGSTPPPAPE
jgi:hypothetical protein